METLTWVAANGSEIVLTDTDSPIRALHGVAGRGAPPVEVTDRPNRSGSGAILEQIRDGARTVDIPASISGDIVTHRRSLVATFDPNTDGRLVSTIDGQSRQLVCRYTGNTDWIEDLPELQRIVLTFKAWQPYWEDVDPIESVFSLGDLGEWTPWGPTDHPIRVVPDNIFAEPAVNNDGDVRAWPVWTIDGPCDDVMLDNQAGDVLIVDNPVAAGGQLIIDTRPGRKTVTDQDGVSRFDALDPVDDRFFAFEPGESGVSIVLTGATAQSRVRLSWRRRWRTT